MCVAITLEIGTTLTEEEVSRMYRSNKDGFGFAWSEDGLVHWWKTLKVKPAEIAHILESFQDHPRIAHFRLSTAGGILAQLCHPFEIGPTANCRQQGSSDRVMIHNGHWGRWDEVKRLLDREGLLPDDGPWSDSRLAAYLAHEDDEWLSALGGKVATLNGEGQIDRIGDWSKFREGIMVSNTYWNHENAPSRGGYAGHRSWPGWHEDEEEKKGQNAKKEPVTYIQEGRRYTWDPATKTLVESPFEDKKSSTSERAGDSGNEGRSKQYAPRISEEKDLSKGGGTSQAPVTSIGSGASVCEYNQTSRCGLQEELGGVDCRDELHYCAFSDDLGGESGE